MHCQMSKIWLMCVCTAFGVCLCVCVGEHRDFAHHHRSELQSSNLWINTSTWDNYQLVLCHLWNNWVAKYELRKSAPCCRLHYFESLRLSCSVRAPWVAALHAAPLFLEHSDYLSVATVQSDVVDEANPGLRDAQYHGCLVIHITTGAASSSYTL